jgi:hypothetical protein
MTVVMRMDFSSRYRRPILLGMAWVVFVGCSACLALDLGESVRVWEITTIPFAILVVLVLWRRPKQPTRMDLLLVAWSFPLLYLMLLALYLRTDGPWFVQSVH